jgi:hypothetical protein
MTSRLGMTYLKDDFVHWETSRDILLQIDVLWPPAPWHYMTMPVFMTRWFLRLTSFDIIVTRRNPQSYVTIHSGVTLVHMHTKLRWVFFFISYVRYFPQSQIQTKNLYPFMEFSVLDFEIHNKLWIYHRVTTRSKFVFINNIFFTLLS